jgi:hypothetical protein
VVKNKKTVKKKNVQNKNDNKSNATLYKEKVIKNPEDDPNGINKHNYARIPNDKNEIITPSGSNFSIMLPNIGVILREDEQIKEGNREFGRYFQKYSLNDYDKILKDYVPVQNKTMIKNKINQSTNNMNLTTIKRIPKEIISNTNNSFKTSSNTISNNLLISAPTQNNINNPELANPLINQADSIPENDSIINNKTNLINNEFNANNNNNSINNSSLFKTIKSYRNQSHSLLYSSGLGALRNGSYDNIAKGVIKLTKNNSSLKNELDSLKDLDDKENYAFFPSNTKNKNTRNIFNGSFRSIFNKNRNKNDITKNSFNEFNKKIISTKGWGNKTLSKNMSTGNLHFGKHLTKYQALRELGSNLLNGIKVKLPRNRKVDIQI